VTGSVNKDTWKYIIVMTTNHKTSGLTFVETTRLDIGSGGF